MAPIDPEEAVSKIRSGDTVRVGVLIVDGNRIRDAVGAPAVYRPCISLPDTFEMIRCFAHDGTVRDIDVRLNSA